MKKATDDKYKYQAMHKLTNNENHILSEGLLMFLQTLAKFVFFRFLFEFHNEWN